MIKIYYLLIYFNKILNSEIKKIIKYYFLYNIFLGKYYRLKYI